MLKCKERPQVLPCFDPFENTIIAESATFYALLPLLLASLEGESIVDARLEVHALVFAAGILSPEVAAVAVEPVVLFAAELEISEPAVVFVVVASVVDVAEPPASADIRVAFPVSAPASLAAAEVGSSGHPRSVPCPNVDYFATPASCFEVAGYQFVHNTSGARANHGLGNRLSISDPRQNKTVEHGHNRPSRGHSNVSGTSDLAMGATTSRSRKTNLPLCQGQRKHSTCQATPLQPGVLEI